jgi:ParB/RepB/Spo0J family partition protein
MEKSTTSVRIESIDLEDCQFRFRDEYKEEEQKALAENIQRYGLQNPVKLRERPGRKLQILAGWRRILATKSFGGTHIEAFIYKNINELEAQEINVLDNAHRRNLNDVEKANQVRTLRVFLRYGIKEIAELLGVGTQHVYDLLTLAKMRPQIQQLVIDGKLNLYHIVELSKLPEELVQKIAEKAAEERWSVKKLKTERRRVTARVVGDPGKLPWDAVRVLKTPEVLNHFRLKWSLLSGVPAPFMCEYTRSIPAQEKFPPYVCFNEVKWAVLAPPNYYYRNEKYQGKEVPFEERNAWAYVCEPCAVKLFGCVRFHDDEDYFSGMEMFKPDPE